MSTTHPTHITTEWEDAQVKYGNLPERKKETPDAEREIGFQNLVERIDPLETKSMNELDELEDKYDEETLRNYRMKRLMEMKEMKKKYRFGSLLQINKSSFTTEVTDASKETNDGVSQLVLILLYSDTHNDSQSIIKALSQFANKHGDIKVCLGVSTDIVPGFPDHRLPALLIYQGGTCKQQLFTLTPFGGPQGLSSDSIEWLLAKKYKLMKTSLTKNPAVTESDDEGAVRKRKDVFKMKMNELSSSDSDYDKEDEERRRKHTDSSDETAEGHRPLTNKNDRGYASTKIDKILDHI